MTPEREKEIQEKVIDVMFRLIRPDLAEPYQTISPVGLFQMLLSIPRDELIEAVTKIDGYRYAPGEIQIPSKHFVGK
jgi:hypothetical protein